MYRTDKQFMKNPATASSRIYIGNLAETVVPDDLEGKFSCHGKVLGLVLQKGFGFIQFETDPQAQAAINNEHGSMFHGRKINVKQAIDNTKGKNNLQPPNQQNNIKQNANNFQHNPSNFQQNQNQNNFQSNQNNFPSNQNNFNSNQNFQNQGNGPNRQNNFSNNHANFQNNQGNFQNNQGNYQNNFTNQQRNIPPLMQKEDKCEPLKLQPPIVSQPPEQQPPNPPNIQSQLPIPQEHSPMQNEEINQAKDKRKPRKPRPQKREFRDDFREDAPPFYEPMYNAPYRAPLMDRPERNDCEIIVVSKALTEYAEYVEQKLKTLGLIVDLLFPNEDVPIGRVLANISSRGCLFAILIMPQNEEHRSLTLNVLHGIPEEHRNMPIEDALLLITKNFETYMRGEDFGGNSSNDKITLTARHPEYIQVILNLLAENRQVTTIQYDKLMIYLQEKRELQGKFEIAEGIDPVTESEAKNKQAELQNRIMTILNKKVEDLSKSADVKVDTKTHTPILNDPSVQKALDSLLSGDVLKGLAS